MESLQAWLLEAHLVTQDDLDRLSGDEPTGGFALASALLERQLIDERSLVALISQRLGVPASPNRLHRISIPISVLTAIPEDLCWQHHFFPFGVDRSAGRLQVAMVDPTDREAVTVLREVIGHDPAVHVIGPNQLEKAIRKHYMDSWVDDTSGGPRFFGYDNITNPGLQPKRRPAAVPQPVDDDPSQPDESKTTETPRIEVAEKAARADATPVEPRTGHPGAASTGRGDPVAPSPAPRKDLGRIPLRDERARLLRRMSTVERTLGELLDLLAELPDARVSSTAARLRRQLGEDD